jgi:hypothetical protein
MAFSAIQDYASAANERRRNTGFKSHPISPGIHAGVVRERAPSAEQQRMLPSASDRGRVKPRTVSASVRFRFIAAPNTRPTRIAPAVTPA